MKKKVCIITGTRAEFGLLQPLIRRVADSKELELQLVVTGSHLLEKFGNTQEEIRRSGFPVYTRVPFCMEGDTPKDMAVSTGDALIRFAEYFSGNRPDLLVVLGDRYEIFAAGTAAAMMGIPIAHIHGGELTEGAVDDFFRHSLTKMSTLHFTACEEYRRRVIQLGEQPDTVYNVGALGVENIRRMPLMTLEQLSESLDFELEEKAYGIVTMHSVTREDGGDLENIHRLIEAMDRFPQLKFIITYANADAGGRVINSEWDKASAAHDNWTVVASLGAKRYLSALKYAAMMIGNSSSGIIEAPAMHIPTVNIGNRQKGRMMAQSVLCCESGVKEIAGAIQTALTEDFRKMCRNVESPFGRGDTSERICAVITDHLRGGHPLNRKKSFYDVRFETDY